MENSLLSLIQSRVSYRGQYDSTPVPRADLTAILAAGLSAPSGCNKQTVSLIAADEPALLAKLKETIDPPIFTSVPAVIFVLSKPTMAYRDKCFAVQDYAAAIENMLLAIHALGYESCWYEGHITDDDRIDLKLAALLGVPEEYRLVCALPVGKALEPLRQAPKKPFAERAWFNGFEGEQAF